jgi:hypothetical protein
MTGLDDNNRKICFEDFIRGRNAQLPAKKQRQRNFTRVRDFRPLNSQFYI